VKRQIEDKALAHAKSKRSAPVWSFAAGIADATSDLFGQEWDHCYKEVRST